MAGAGVWREDTEVFSLSSRRKGAPVCRERSRARSRASHFGRGCLQTGREECRGPRLELRRGCRLELHRCLGGRWYLSHRTGWDTPGQKEKRPEQPAWGPGSAGQGEEDSAVTQGDDQEREQLWEPREEAGRPPEQRTDPRFGSAEVTDNPELP